MKSHAELFTDRSDLDREWILARGALFLYRSESSVRL